MSHFLVYLSEVVIKNVTQLNLIIQALNKIGTLRGADQNIYVLETTESHQTIQNTIRSHAPQHANFFVATIKGISVKGSYQFGSTLELLEEQKAPANFRRPIEYPPSGVV